ncbi:MAG: hypothetical protein GF364_10280 [Candidatus Lokiarchaeota archaeon]|nr:hypothetical protein [Candidatus Lokiarchaeota archaeon]
MAAKSIIPRMQNKMENILPEHVLNYRQKYTNILEIITDEYVKILMDRK